MILISDQEQNIKKLNDRFKLRFKPENILSLTRKNRLTEQQANLLRQAYDIANRIYPGEVSLELKFAVTRHTHQNTYGSGGNRYSTFEVFDGYIVERAYLDIRFPEIEMSNKTMNKHTIYDLIVRQVISFRSTLNTFRFDQRLNTYTLFEQLEGLRMTCTLYEMKVNYAHSHLPTGTTSYFLNNCNKNNQDTGYMFQQFCTGEGDINITKANLCAEFNEENMELHLYQILSYISWESIDGGPFIEYRNVEARNTSIPGQFYTLYYYIDKIKQYRLPLELDWENINGDMRILDNDTLEEALKDIFYDDYSNNTNMFLYRSPDGIYYKLANNNLNNEVAREYKNYIIFQNKKLFFRTINSNTNQATERIRENLFINPNIKNNVRLYIERKAKEAITRKGIIERYNKSRSIRFGIEPSEISM